jgi:hypothetical protein
MVNFGSVSPLKTRKICGEERRSQKKKAQPVDPMEELSWDRFYKTPFRPKFLKLQLLIFILKF